jgi:hypothetical protein
MHNTLVVAAAYAGNISTATLGLCWLARRAYVLYLFTVFNLVPMQASSSEKEKKERKKERKSFIRSTARTQAADLIIPIKGSGRELIS